MSLSTFSIFYFDFEITNTAKNISFDEGSGELIAEIQTGSYTPTELATEIKVALEAVGANTYAVTFNRSSRSFTISSTVAFDLLVTSGTAGSSAYDVLGFQGADRTALLTYTGAEAGDFYIPQFIIQDHIDKENYQKLVDPSVQKTATGRVEVVRFGIAKFIQMNFKYITNKPNDGAIIKNNPNGVEDLQRFMQFLMLKKPVEFMADTSDRDTFEQLILETSPDDSMGTGYKLKELYDKGLPDVFESGILLFRVLE
jgi:hypothetical protein